MSFFYYDSLSYSFLPLNMTQVSTRSPSNSTQWGNRRGHEWAYGMVLSILQSTLASFSCPGSLNYLTIPLASLSVMQDFSHPDGPNIGPASDSCWFENHDQHGIPAKTDLLHTGHVRGGKLLIVSSFTVEISFFLSRCLFLVFSKYIFLWT